MMLRRLTLNLICGVVRSVVSFEIEGELVKTELFAHQDQDQISVKVTSPLIAAGRLKISLRLPYGSGEHHASGYDFSQAEKHLIEVVESKNIALFRRELDSTLFYVKAAWKQEAKLLRQEQHYYFLVPDEGEDSFNFTVSFSPENDVPIESFEDTYKNNLKAWETFWESGGAIEFTGSTDPRAAELERRIVLSQYLTKIQSSGNLPPQETGLTSNSWYGKFHLEMHWWHGVHFVLWNRPDLFEASMGWYKSILPKAKATAEWQGYEGARWPKMVGPDGVEGPSNVAPFLIWQQPHPIYYAELFYRQNPSIQVLEEHKEIVFETADFMASFTCFNDSSGYYDLPAPLIPAQEVFDLHNTVNPTFELAYWHYALTVAQKWRERLQMEPNKDWQLVLDRLAPLPIADGMYLPHQNRPDAYQFPQFMKDHPIVLGFLGFLTQTEKVNPEIMRKTFKQIWNNWNWDHTWGWDYPLVAMTAARLGMPEKAVEALLMDVQKNTYLKNGHNYQRQTLPVYLPGKGGLLAAIAMMASGWDHNSSKKPFPGFPDDGRWKIRAENITGMP